MLTVYKRMRTKLSISATDVKKFTRDKAVRYNDIWSIYIKMKTLKDTHKECLYFSNRLTELSKRVIYLLFRELRSLHPRCIQKTNKKTNKQNPKTHILP